MKGRLTAIATLAAGTVVAVTSPAQAHDGRFEADCSGVRLYTSAFEQPTQLNVQITEDATPLFNGPVGVPAGSGVWGYPIPSLAGSGNHTLVVAAQWPGGQAGPQAFSVSCPAPTPPPTPVPPPRVCAHPNRTVTVKRHGRTIVASKRVEMVDSNGKTHHRRRWTVPSRVTRVVVFWVREHNCKKHSVTFKFKPDFPGNG